MPIDSIHWYKEPSKKVLHWMIVPKRGRKKPYCMYYLWPSLVENDWNISYRFWKLMIPQSLLETPLFGSSGCKIGIVNVLRYWWIIWYWIKDIIPNFGRNEWHLLINTYTMEYWVNMCCYENNPTHHTDWSELPIVGTNTPKKFGKNWLGINIL